MHDGLNIAIFLLHRNSAELIIMTLTNYVERLDTVADAALLGDILPCTGNHVLLPAMPRLHFFTDRMKTVVREAVISGPAAWEG